MKFLVKGRVIYAIVEEVKDGDTTWVRIVKVGRSTCTDQTTEFRYEGNLQPNERMEIVSQLENYDIEMEQQSTVAAETYCQAVIDDESCPRPNRILSNMCLNEQGHRLGLKPAIVHGIVEDGIQNYHGVSSPSELGMHDEQLFEDCWSFQQHTTSAMRDTIVSFAKSNGINMTKLQNALYLALSSWPPDLLDIVDLKLVIPMILEEILEMDCWLDPFSEPSSDAKVSGNAYSNRYDKDSKVSAHNRTTATLDSIGEGIAGLIRHLGRNCETVHVRTTDSTKINQPPPFTVLLLDTNHTLGRDHRSDLQNRDFTMIYRAEHFQEGTLELWMRHDCLIIYHSPFYRGTCTKSTHPDDPPTAEPVRRHISIMLESVRRTLCFLRNQPAGGPDEPNLIEAYFVRLLACAGLHVGQYIATAVWKHYVLNYLVKHGEKFNCLVGNRLPKTAEGSTFAYPCGGRSRSVARQILKRTTNNDSDEASQLLTDATTNATTDATTDGVAAMSAVDSLQLLSDATKNGFVSTNALTKTGVGHNVDADESKPTPKPKRVDDNMVFDRALSLLTQIQHGHEPGGVLEEAIFVCVLELLKEDASYKLFKKRIERLAKEKISDRGLADRLLKFSKKDNVNTGNTSTSRRGKRADTATTQQRMTAFEDYCSTGDDPQPFWIKQSNETQPSNLYKLEMCTTHKYGGLREAISKDRFVKYDKEGRRYRVYSLNQNSGIDRFKKSFPHSKAIPAELDYKKYLSIKNGYVLAMLLPEGTWETTASSASFKESASGQKRSESAAVGCTSAMKKLKTSL